MREGATMAEICEKPKADGPKYEQAKAKREGPPRPGIA